MAFRSTPSERGVKLELLVDDKPVSSLILFDLRMGIGGVPLRCGGIGGVSTPRAQRMHGYSRRVLAHSVEVMRAEGYEIAALFGIPDYYHRFGFASALVEGEIVLATRDAELAVARYPVREFEPADARAIAELYVAHCAVRNGYIVRDPETWTGIAKGAGWSDRVGTYVALDGDRVVGYASYTLDARRFGLGEVVAVNASIYSTLLAEAARRAIAFRVERIPVQLPPDDPFCRPCRRYGAEIKVTYARCAGGMVRLIDQTAVLHKLQPLLAGRLAASPLADWQGSLVLETELGSGTLTFGNAGRAVRARIPQGTLTQLLLGYRDVADVAFEGDLEAEDAAVPLLDALFPSGYPYVWMADRF